MNLLVRKAADKGQIERVTRYAEKEGLSHKLKYTKGDFMVRLHFHPAHVHALTRAANVFP